MNYPGRAKRHDEAFKVVWADGFARDAIAEHVVAEQLSYEDAITVCEQLRDASRDASDWWWVKKQDAKLWRGMEEFV